MKKNIVLADNSYTIRRIVELSFSDEEDIELVSYENGQDITDKLLELKPSVVLVDIKLPEMNGYEVCKFINESDELKNTKVFLIKGGFEPVDEEQLSGLKYEDFITKPFDSKALVITIKSIVDEPESEPAPEPEPESTETIDIPSSMPEEISEISDIMDKSDSIDFSDVQSEGDPGGLMDTIVAPDSETSIKEEVLPSEEITQGAGFGESEDKLSPDVGEEISNPFEDSAGKSSEIEPVADEEAIIKENIRIQEEELEIGSLTMEEINIQKNIDQQKEVVQETVSDPLVTESPVEPQKTEEANEVPEEGKDQLDPSLSNMNSSDLENVFSINNAEVESNSVSDPVTISDKEEEVPDMDSKEETKEKSEEIKEVLEKLETESKEKIEPVTPKEETAEKMDKDGLADQLASLTNLQGSNKIVEKIEDRLTVSVKEILWEIVPPLAEKIIKGEINKLKSDIEKEYK
ncbi:MAG: response regulator [Candidatus Aminicenantes bacterium]|nr:response regulator [Candidatus Aminicenantes bacterium]